VSCHEVEPEFNYKAQQRCRDALAGLGCLADVIERDAGICRTCLKVGYRHIDTATLYGNEAEVGVASARAASHARSIHHDKTLEQRPWPRRAPKAFMES